MWDGSIKTSLEGFIELLDEAPDPVFCFTPLPVCFENIADKVRPAV